MSTTTVSIQIPRTLRAFLNASKRKAIRRRAISLTCWRRTGPAGSPWGGCLARAGSLGDGRRTPSLATERALVPPRRRLATRSTRGPASESLEAGHAHLFRRGCHADHPRVDSPV